MPDECPFPDEGIVWGGEEVGGDDNWDQDGLAEWLADARREALRAVLRAWAEEEDERDVNPLPDPPLVLTPDEEVQLALWTQDTTEQEKQ